MKNTKLKFFIDSTVTISAITGRNKDAWILFESGKKSLISLFVNEFVINYAIDYVSECCFMRTNVPRTKLAILVTEDNALKNDAKKIIQITVISTTAARI